MKGRWQLVDAVSKETRLGRIRVTTQRGALDEMMAPEDSTFEQAYIYGGRSFAIAKLEMDDGVASKMHMVYERCVLIASTDDIECVDSACHSYKYSATQRLGRLRSGDMIERLHMTHFTSMFNAEVDDMADPVSENMDKRSDNKGVEPESIEVSVRVPLRYRACSAQPYGAPTLARVRLHAFAASGQLIFDA